jgi:hypothetical protein
MSVRGIGIEGVVYEIAALGREFFCVDKGRLIESLQTNFQADHWEVYDAIEQAKRVNVVKEFCGKIYLVFHL